MILKGNPASHGKHLAKHLMSRKENDHVELHEIRGLLHDENLQDAFEEIAWHRDMTQCRQHLYHLVLNPPKPCEKQILLEAIETSETTLGLSGQPRAIVFHEKDGCRHAHVVWSRIDVEQQKAIPIPFDKRRLQGLSKDLFLQYGWELPKGYDRAEKPDPQNYSHAEAQQAKRTGISAEERKALIREAFEKANSPQGFQQGLQERGMVLCQGRRDYLALSLWDGEATNLARATGKRVREMRRFFGEDYALMSHEEAQAQAKAFQEQGYGEARQALEKAHQREQSPLEQKRQQLLKEQDEARQRLKQTQPQESVSHGLPFPQGVQQHQEYEEALIEGQRQQREPLRRQKQSLEERQKQDQETLRQSYLAYHQEQALFTEEAKEKDPPKAERHIENPEPERTPEEPRKANQDRNYGYGL